MSEELVIPSPNEVRALVQVLRDQQTFERAKENARVMAAGHVGPREALPLRDDEVGEFGHYEATIPAKHYWAIRQKYGDKFFKDDGCMKDLRRHHPEYFCRTVSGRITNTPKYSPQRRVKFDRGTLQLAN
jgi:hypothetical protein